MGLVFAVHHVHVELYLTVLRLCLYFECNCDSTQQATLLRSNVRIKFSIIFSVLPLINTTTVNLCSLYHQRECQKRSSPNTNLDDITLGYRKLHLGLLHHFTCTSPIRSV